MFVVAAVVAADDDVLFFSFCLFVCMFPFFSLFAKLVLFRFLAWFSISLTCLIYIHVISFCAFVLVSTNIFYCYIPKLINFVFPRVLMFPSISSGET